MAKRNTVESIKPIVVVQPEWIDAATSKALRNAGYLVVTTANPAAFKIVTPPPRVPLDSVAIIALQVMADANVSAFEIRNEFHKRCLAAAVAAISDE